MKCNIQDWQKQLQGVLLMWIMKCVNELIYPDRQIAPVIDHSHKTSDEHYRMDNILTKLKLIEIQNY